MNTYSWAELLQLIADSWLRPANRFGHPEWPMLFGDEIGRLMEETFGYDFTNTINVFRTVTECANIVEIRSSKLWLKWPDQIQSVHQLGIRVSSCGKSSIYQMTQSFNLFVPSHMAKFSKVSIWDKLWVTHLDKKLVLNSHTCHTLHESIPSRIST